MTETIVVAPLALTLHWDADTIVRLDLLWAGSHEESQSLSESAVALKEALQRYIEGEAPEWPDLPYDFSSLSKFQKAALDALYCIPYGKLATYKDLARQVGKPKGAQAMGKAMGANPFPLVYPCHRVIAANGKFTGFSAEGGLEMKMFLLRHEGAIL